MSNLIDRFRVFLTSIGLATVLAASPCSIARASSAENGNEYSYDIKYILDESKTAINDNYDEELMEKYRNAPDDLVVDVPEYFRSDVLGHVSKDDDDDITVGDLRSIDYLMLSVSDKTVGDIDFRWINYCSNLKELYLYGDLIKHADDILGFDNIKYISLSTRYNEYIMDLSNCGFINHCPNLETLFIGGMFDTEQLYNLNVKHLSLSLYDTHTIDFKKLNVSEELTLFGGAYNIAIYLSNDDIDYLESKGVKISFGTNEHVDIEQIREINDRLDEIVESLGLDENATDEEKVRAVLIYVLSNLQYDEYASQCQKEKKSYDQKPFYLDGDLYGALNGQTHICGNYSALTSALLHRVGVDDYYLSSNGHSWNLVEIDGEWYYFDSTWLDDDIVIIKERKWEDIPGGKSLTITHAEKTVEEVLASGDQEALDQLLWYKVLPSDYNDNPEKYHDYADEDDEEKKYSHDVVNFPITIVEVKTENTNSNAVSEEEQSSNVLDATVSKEKSKEDNALKDTPKTDRNFGQKVFDVTIGNKIFRGVAGGALIGLFVALGIAIPVKINIKRKEEEERRRQLSEMYYDDTDYKPQRRRKSRGKSRYFNTSDD